MLTIIVTVPIDLRDFGIDNNYFLVNTFNKILLFKHPLHKLTSNEQYLLPAISRFLLNRSYFSYEHLI